MTSIIISHKLAEIAYVADKITIMRDGATIETIDNSARNIDEARIIRGMVGRELTDRFPKRSRKTIGDPVLEVMDWSVHHPVYTEKEVVSHVSFHVNRGEIVGFSGLQGAGRTELARSLFGRSFGTGISGTLRINGKEVYLKNERAAIEAGLAYVTEDRKENGLVLIDTIARNNTMLSAASCNKWWMEDILQTREYSSEQRNITDDRLGRNAVFFLPYLMGERSPHNDPAARGMLIGMTMGFHCGNTPSCKLCADRAVKYQLIQHRLLEPKDSEPDFTRGTLEGDIAPSDITFYRLQCDSEGQLRSYIAQGEVLPVKTRSFGGIGVFAIPEMGRFYRHVLLQKRYPHHGAVVFGHYGKALFEVMLCWMPFARNILWYCLCWYCQPWSECRMRFVPSGILENATSNISVTIDSTGLSEME